MFRQNSLCFDKMSKFRVFPFFSFLPFSLFSLCSGYCNRPEIKNFLSDFQPAMDVLCFILTQDNPLGPQKPKTETESLIHVYAYYKERKGGGVK